MPDHLRILGPWFAPTGYSHMTRAALRMALDAGYTVQAVESDYRLQFTMHTDGRIARSEVPPKMSVPLADELWEEIQTAQGTAVPSDAPTLLIQLPPNLNQRGHYVDTVKIGWTMAESDTLCPLWTWGCRGVDTVFVPSRWCVNAFERAGLADVRLMPIPVDDRLWSVTGHPLELPGHNIPDFLFISVFSTTERKQWRQLMQAFSEEFADEPRKVGLIVHPSQAREVEEMAGWCRAGGAWVWVDKDTRNDYDMAALYRRCDCYAMVSPEGQGLPYIEAALCGIPSIAPDAGGAADCVDEETGYRVPTMLRPCVGHMPHVYPSSHRWPLADIQDIRAVLRTAYEERDGPLLTKGRNARKRALERWTPKAIASRFREEIERAVQIRRGTETIRETARTFAFMKDSPHERERSAQYALAMGAWGDTFVSAGMALQMRDTSRPLHFIHYGYDRDIAEFLRAQPFVGGVIQIQPPADRKEMLREFSKICQSRWAYTHEWLPWIAEMAGVPADDILFTQINQTENQPLHRWHDAVLPADVRAWARAQRGAWGEYVLLHPLSVQSAHASEHWPCWHEALDWLITETPYTYVLTGTVPLTLPKTPRLIDMIGRTKTMMEVLALCEESIGVIATCNAIAHWTVMQRIPGLICSNAVFNCHSDYYHRFTNHPPNTILYQYDTLEWFQFTARRWLAMLHGQEEAHAVIEEPSDVAEEVTA